MEQESIENYFLHFLTGSQLLRAPESIQNKIIKTPGFLQKILQYLASEHTPNHFKVITILHPILVDVFSKLDQESQDDLRGGLLNAVVELHTDLKCVSGIAMLIRQIIEKDGPEVWMKPLSEFLKWVQSDDLEIMEAGIQFFIYLLRQTPYNSSNTDIPLYKLSSPLLNTLFQIVAQSQVTQTMRQKLLYLVLQIIKTFSFYSGSQDNIVKQCMDDTYQIWMSFFVSALQSSLYFHYLTIKKYIMKILVIIYRDMLKYSQKSLVQNLGKIWQFTYQLLPLYIHNVVWDQPVSTFPNAENAKIQSPNLYYDDDTDSFLSPIEGLALISLQYLSVVASSPISTLITRISIHHLTNTLFHYMLINNSDLKNWYSNPTHFFNQGGISDAQAGIRGKVLGILNELIERYSDLALQAILLISEKFLINHSQAHSTEIMNEYLEHLLSNSSIGLEQQNKQKIKELIKISGCDIQTTLKLEGEAQRKIETSLVILSRFAEDIIVFQSKQQAAFDIQSFIKGLSKQILVQEYHFLLKGQSLYCLTRFTEIISIKYKMMFTDLLIVTTKCLTQKSPMPVKMVGCKALTTFCRKIQKHKLKISQSQLQLLNKAALIENIITMDLQSDTVITILQALIELGKISNNYINNESKQELYKMLIPPQYLLLIFHKFNRHPNSLTLFFNLLDILLTNKSNFAHIYKVLIQFVAKCLSSYKAVIVTQQKKLLKALDTDLITQILKILNVIIVESSEKQSYQFIVQTILDYLCQIIQHNEDVQIHIGTTICLKNLIKGAHSTLKQKNYVEKIVEAIKNLLKIPTDKTFESASLYSGNLTILSSKMLFSKTNYTILQDAVLKIFRSRTPSVIQSLVLIYSTILNSNTSSEKPFEKERWEVQATEAIDFLASFSIQNRMGLKILIDKWLLQQSLFRGRYTKVSTFMALSKLFLLRDKRVDNLLVIGFNPSHTRVCIDVNAPLKILATLIRCLENEMGKKKGDDQQDDDQNSFSNMKQQGQLDVEMEKFKQQQVIQGSAGGLADRENQQGSTCYMSAMLQFYDDGEQCDQTTEQDLQYLKDSSVQFQLGQYLLNFFNYLNENQPEYFKNCLKGLLKQDIKNLQKYINVSI